MKWSDINSQWEEKIRQYADYSKAEAWFEENYNKIRSLFEDAHVRDVIFAPIKQAIRLTDASTEGQVRTTIASVALANAAMATLPGKLGVGVWVCMALEVWMALKIARLVGIKDIEKPTDILVYFGLIAGVIGTIGWGFVHIFRFVFSLIVNIPGVPATFVTELFVTNLIGVLFWVGFKEARSSGSFTIPRRLLNRVYRTTNELFRHQANAIKEVLTPAKLAQVRDRLRAWLTGDILLPNMAPAEFFIVGAFAALLRRDFSKLEGPLGDVFIQSIRDRWSRELSEASVEQIAEYMTRYDTDQLVGVMSVIKGKMFEHLIAIHENADGDAWSANLHEDERYPGSDIVFTNIETGETIEVSLKAVEDPSIIEHSLLKYPDIPILTTTEMGDEFSNIDMVFASHISNENLAEDADQIFEEMMSMTSTTAGRAQTILGVGVGTAAAGVVQLWPFVAAFMRGRISKEDLETGFMKVLGDEGVKLAGRVALAAVFGPVYAWYLLAKGVIRLTSGDDGSADKEVSRQKSLLYKPRVAFTI